MGGGNVTPRELAVDAATFAGAEALLHRYEDQHREGHHPLRDAALAGAAAYGVQKLQSHRDQRHMMMQQPQYQQQQPYGYSGQPYGQPYYGGYGYPGYGGGSYNVYNGYNTYNMYGGDMYQNPYMPYGQHFHNRRHLGGYGGYGMHYNGAMPARYTIMPPGGAMGGGWGMQQPYF
jgi:hypothetical protein